ncbi:MAG: universal stress protein [Dehalococcoidia bacterium]|nr:universal stress protein [Dehalococcoidia bacterium]MCB9485275.1 universal stress protein [Thermoflexaceae bacterium]
MPVLVSTDGSSRSLAALPHAARLASALNEEVVLLRVLDPHKDCAGESAATLRERVDRVAARFVRELEDALARESITGTARVITLLHGEDTYEAILASVALASAGLVALDTRGGGALRHLLFGSVALQVLSHARTPLLLTGPAVRPPLLVDPYHVFMTTDGSGAGDAALIEVAALCARARARLTIWQAVEPRLVEMGASPPAVTIRARLRSLAGSLPPGVSSELVVDEVETVGEIAGAAIRAAGSRQASCIAMATHGHSRRYHSVAGSVAMGVLQHSPLPVLLTRSRD